MIRKYYLSSPRFTVQVNVDDGKIVWGAPVIGRFRGQPFENLIRWSKADVVEEIHQGSEAAHSGVIMSRCSKTSCGN